MTSPILGREGCNWHRIWVTEGEGDGEV